jgi:hypothetical protein
MLHQSGRNEDGRDGEVQYGGDIQQTKGGILDE